MAGIADWLGIRRYQADERYRAALRHFSQRDLTQAQESITQALELLPGHAEYHAAQGFFAQTDKSHQRADEAFDRALQLNPYEMLANYGRGVSSYREKQWQRAADCFVKALAAQPNRAETLYYLAMTQHRLGENGAAVKWMSAAARQFAKADDHRERHCHSWLREFEKLLEPQEAG